MAIASAAAADAVPEAAEAGTAQEDSTAAELAPVLVDEERPEAQAPLVERSMETPDDVSGFGETIFAEPGWRSFESTAELLGQSVGAQLRRQGGREDFSTLTIRGAPSAQLRILLDGVPLGRASDSVVNLADLPLDTVERIEVYRGFAPAGLTPVSAAGVVNVVTRDPEKATASAAAGGGSFGSAKVNAAGAGPVAGGSAAAFASYRHTDGDFEYLAEGDPNNPADDSVRKRGNNDSDAVESLLRWRRGVGDGWRVQLRNHVFYKEEGIPDSPDVRASKARLETVRDIAAASLGSADGRWSAEQIVTWQNKKLSEFGPAFDNEADTTASTTAARWGRPLGDSHWLSGSGEFTWEGFDQQREAVSAVDQQADRSSLAIAAGDDWTVKKLKTTLTVQLRHQEIRNDSRGGPSGSDRSTDPRVGLRWQPLPGLAIKSNVSTYFRPPSFDELYGTDGFTTGNSELKPEDGLAWDAGFEWTGGRSDLGKLQFGYAWFGSDIDNMILVFLTFDRSAKAMNAAKAKIRGHEVRAEWQGPAGFALSANYTYQDAENRSNLFGVTGKDLAGLPPHEAWARLSWARGPFVIAYDVGVTGAHHIQADNLDPKLPTRTVHGLSVVLGPFLQSWRLTLEAENLGGSLVPDQFGFPLPSRAFFATLSWSAAPRGGEGDAR
ncbi:MAG: TonB-dependent receptor plug domain-containing protein [Candidatus Binatia bacterium]